MEWNAGQIGFIHSFVPFFHPPPPNTVLRSAPKSRHWVGLPLLELPYCTLHFVLLTAIWVTSFRYYTAFDSNLTPQDMSQEDIPIDCHWRQTFHNPLRWQVWMWLKALAKGVNICRTVIRLVNNTFNSSNMFIHSSSIQLPEWSPLQSGSFWPADRDECIKCMWSWLSPCLAHLHWPEYCGVPH